MTKKVTRKMFIERMNAATNELREYANRQVETTNFQNGPYPNQKIETINVRYDDNCTAIRRIGEGASILRFDEEDTFSINHNYLDPIGSLNADEAEQMAWELLAAASELRKIEREHTEK
nr:MAG TPA: hypothetical protein [Caudoviricetes sp.]